MKAQILSYLTSFPTLREYFPNLSLLQLFVIWAIMRMLPLLIATCIAFFSSITVVVGHNQNTLIYNDYPFLTLLQVIDKTQVIDQFHNMTGYLPNVSNTLGHAARKTMSAGSTNIHLMGHLWCDIIDIDSLLLKHTPFSIQLNKQIPAFMYRPQLVPIITLLLTKFNS